MFKCAFCKKTTEPHERLHLVTVETHKVTQKNVFRFDEDSDTKIPIVTNEIKRQAKCCNACRAERERAEEEIALKEARDKLISMSNDRTFEDAFGVSPKEILG